MAHYRHLTVSQFYALQYLEEVAKHYNSGNRSANRSNLCLYVPKDFKKSEGCAIGRKLTEKEKKLIVGSELNETDVEGLIEKIGRLEFFRLISTRYLIYIQSLHDDRNFWDEKGLSRDGRINFKRIYKQIAEKQPC